MHLPFDAQRNTLPPRTRAAGRVRGAVQGWVLTALLVAAALLRGAAPVGPTASDPHVAVVGATEHALPLARTSAPQLERAVRHAPRGAIPRGDTPFAATPQAQREGSVARSGAMALSVGLVAAPAAGRGYDATAPPRIER